MRRGIGIFPGLVGAALLGLATTAWSDEIDDLRQEVEALKEKVRKIEEQEVEVRDELGHRLHPVRSLFGVKISGGLTGILQGSLRNEEQFGGNRSEGSMSSDLFLEWGLGERSSFLLRLDVVQGAGISSVPPLFASPNGNTTGTNNDIEGFNEPRLNLNEARFEHSFNHAIALAFGQLDLTSYFDENKFANDETLHFLAQQFDNNPAIEWGGSDNFFGPGIVLVGTPADSLDLSLGWFEGDGNYEKFFRQPFLIGQLTFKARPGGREGYYRFYGWGRLTPHCKDAARAEVFFNCGPSDDAFRVKGGNTGLGWSLDQQVSDSIGIWLRFGYQDSDVSQFDKAVSLGAALPGIPGRAKDVVGLAYGAVFPSNAYEGATGRSDTEHYAEVYYRYIVYGDEVSGMHLTPDMQMVVNPGGDGNVDPVFVWGFRTQVLF